MQPSQIAAAHRLVADILHAYLSTIDRLEGRSRGGEKGLGGVSAAHLREACTQIGQAMTIGGTTGQEHAIAAREIAIASQVRGTAEGIGGVGVHLARAATALLSDDHDGFVHHAARASDALALVRLAWGLDQEAE